MLYIDSGLDAAMDASHNGRLTSYEYIFIGCAHKLHSLLSEQSHVLIDGVVGDILVGAVI